MVVHRESARTPQEDAIHGGIGAVRVFQCSVRVREARHDQLLPVRGHPHEADGYMDECLVVDASAYLQERRPVPCGGAQGLEDGHPGHRELPGSQQDSRSIIRGDIRTDAYMKIDIMKGKGHGQYTVAMNGTRMGMKDGYGYSILATIEVDDQEIRNLLSESKDETS